MKGGSGGSASVTMAEVARLAGVSESTVSRALADNPLISVSTRAKIQEIARRTGFSVNPHASGLRSKKTNVIAVVITLIHDRSQHVSDPFMMTMLAHIADALADAGCDMLLSKVSAHEDGWIERLFATRRPAAALLVGQSLEHEAIEQAAKAGLPIVAWGAGLGDQTYAVVGSDNRQGGYLAAKHLISLGRQRIAFLGDRALPEIGQRFDGVVRALAEAGLPANAGLVHSSGFNGAGAFEAASALIREAGPFDALVAASDVIAMSAIRALLAAGRRVPQDVSVVGFDDIDMAAYTTPPLTTVRQDLALGAQLLVERAVALANGEAVASVTLPASLVVRESTARRA